MRMSEKWMAESVREREEERKEAAAAVKKYEAKNEYCESELRP